MALSVAFPQSWGSDYWTAALAKAVAGFGVGLFATWILIELGKLAFGRVKHSFAEPERWAVTQPDDEQPPVLMLGTESYGWADLFSRKTDRLEIVCPTLNVSGRTFERVKSVLMMETLMVTDDTRAEQKFRLENVTELHGTTTEVVLPREALGFGVALLNAMTGTFVGPKHLVYIFSGTLILGILVTICSSRTRGFPKIEVAPFVLVAYVIFLVLRHFMVL
jgi:leader peptidase (prepilin peptidase)/N-methyltransferase